MVGFLDLLEKRVYLPRSANRLWAWGNNIRMKSDYSRGRCKSVEVIFPPSFRVLSSGTRTGNYACPINGYVTGHLISHKFNGPCEKHNLVAISSGQNSLHSSIEREVDLLLQAVSTYNEQTHWKPNTLLLYGLHVALIRYKVTAWGNLNDENDLGFTLSVGTPKAVDLEVSVSLGLGDIVRDKNGSPTVIVEQPDSFDNFIATLGTLERQDRHLRREGYRFRSFEISDELRNLLTVGVRRISH